jgi:hypothetical protein
MNYESHWFQNQSPPPNVNFACIDPGGSISGRPTYTNPCAISNYTNIIPSYYTFDLSLGYSTGDRPANEYLRSINIQVVAENITDKTHPSRTRLPREAVFSVVVKSPRPCTAA